MAKTIRLFIASILLVTAQLASVAMYDYIAVMPLVAYRADRSDRTQSRYPNPLFESAEQAFQDAKSHWDYCDTLTGTRIES